MFFRLNGLNRFELEALNIIIVRIILNELMIERIWIYFGGFPGLVWIIYEGTFHGGGKHFTLKGHHLLLFLENLIFLLPTQDHVTNFDRKIDKCWWRKP